MARSDCKSTEASTSEMDTTGQAVGSLVQSTGLLHASAKLKVEQSTCWIEKEPGEEFQSGNLGVSVQESSDSRSDAESSTSDQGNLGVLTQNKAECLEESFPALVGKFNYRPAELVRLINGTPLGIVISDRQLYRHRQRAPNLSSDGKTICLFRYCAWLFQERQRRRAPKKRRRRHDRDMLSIAELRELLEEQNYRCALTGARLTPTNFDLDHIIPVSEGGDFSKANCQLVTTTVNRAKNTMSEKAFIAMCKRVARHRAGSS